MYWLAEIKANILKNNNWQSILKNSIAITITLIIGVIPAVVAVYGRLTYLGAMVAVFAPPGQRFGQMAEGLILVLLGSILGIAWGMLGLLLSSLVLDSNVSAAYGLRATFLAIAVVTHGILRASTPRLFLLVFWLFLMSLVILTSGPAGVSLSLLTELAYPIVTAVAVVILVNVLIYPSFSNSLLGQSTVSILHETMRGLVEANEWFLYSITGLDNAKRDDQEVNELRTRLAVLSERKTKLKAQLALSQKQQAECNFELAYTFLPPRALKPISGVTMTRLVKSAIALIGTCESKYSMIGDGHNGSQTDSRPESRTTSKDEWESHSDSSTTSSEAESDSSDSEGSARRRHHKGRHLRRIELVKPVREIESGDINLLEHLVFQVRAPISALQSEMEQAMQAITSVLAFCFDISMLPPPLVRPSGIIAADVDLRIEQFRQALEQFDQESATALGQAASTVYKKELKVSHSCHFHLPHTCHHLPPEVIWERDCVFVEK